MLVAGGRLLRRPLWLAQRSSGSLETRRLFSSDDFSDEGFAEMKAKLEADFRPFDENYELMEMPKSVASPKTVGQLKQWIKEDRGTYPWMVSKGNERLGSQFYPRRTGVMAMKIGMMHGWDEYGVKYPLTVLMVENNWVTQLFTKERDGYDGVQVGAGFVKGKHVNLPQILRCQKLGVPLCKHYTEFRVTKEGLDGLEVGTPLGASHFVPGQYVDVQGKTIGKGFQGVMKRWGFKGQPATHGVSLAHRSAGSIGNCQDPGRVLPGKKMAGRMGGRTKTLQNLLVFKTDLKRNLVYVQGSVPGNKGGMIKIRDAVKKPARNMNGESIDLPFPCYDPSKDENTELIRHMPKPNVNDNEPIN
mmetsp:Transcript_18136/g.29427  ORF Transcript_18136/g.29427 Transcript_18136/m.29427 type:complete len:359 (-) Transcript_18136:1102-2178(-)